MRSCGRGTDAPPNFRFYANPAPYYLASRVLTVLLSLGTILLLWLIGRSSGSPAVGLFAAGLLALNPLHVAQSKVAVPDTHLAFCVLASLYCARRAVRGLRLLPLLTSSLCVGLATAAKFNGAFVGLAPAAALLLMGRGMPLRRCAGLAIASGACVGLGYFLGNPYGVLHPKLLYIGFRYAFALSHGAHFWQEPQSALREYCSAIGPEVGLAGVLGGIGLWVRSSKEDRKTILPETAFVAFFFAYMALAPLHFPRFILPLVAPLCLYASWGCTAVVEGVLVGKGARRVALILCYLLLVSRGVSEIVQVELRKARGETLVLVSRWVEANLPEGAKVATEWNGIRTPGLSDLEDSGLKGQQIREALAQFGGKGLRLERLPWSVGEHPLAWYRGKGIQYVVLNEDIRDRVFRDPSLREMQQNYLEIPQRCTLVARFIPLTPEGLEIDGPAITVYRTTP